MICASSVLSGHDLHARNTPASDLCSQSYVWRREGWIGGEVRKGLKACKQGPKRAGETKTDGVAARSQRAEAVAVRKNPGPRTACAKKPATNGHDAQGWDMHETRQVTLQTLSQFFNGWTGPSVNPHLWDKESRRPNAQDHRHT